jgi:nucleoside-diphosphate-sugar epimerase
MPAPWVIVGCGYTGAYLARALVGRGVAVTLTRRDPAAAAELADSLIAGAGGGSRAGTETDARGRAGTETDARGRADTETDARGRAGTETDARGRAGTETDARAGTETDARGADAEARGDRSSRPIPVVRGVVAELGDPASLAGLVAPGAIVCCLAPPGPDPAGEIRNLLEASRDAARLVYVSSTSVYAPGGGAWVDESWPIAPTTGAGRARALAEQALAASPVPWIALRAAGIHGPGRKLVDRIRSGTYRVIGDGTSHVSRIHVVDLVSAILAAGASEARGFVNVADDDPTPIGEVVDTLAGLLGLPPPPRVPASSVPPELAGMLTADRRIANRRLKEELGVKLRYPSWRSEL